MNVPLEGAPVDTNKVLIFHHVKGTKDNLAQSKSEFTALSKNILTI